MSHLQFMHRVVELVREVQNYHDDLRKKKRKIRENEQKTAQLVEAFRGAKQQLAKARDQFHQITAEIERHRRHIEYIGQQQPQQYQQAMVSLVTNTLKLERKVPAARDDYITVIIFVKFLLLT